MDQNIQKILEIKNKKMLAFSENCGIIVNAL